MKKILSISCVLILFLASCQQKKQELKVNEIIGNQVISVNGKHVKIAGMGEPGTTTFFLVRHAEKRAVENPLLTEKGVERANKLAAILKDIPLKAIYSTFTNRTRATAAPCAEMRELQIINYDAENQKKLIENIMRFGAGESYLIVGHSNTIPSLLNLFKGKDLFKNIDENVFDDLYIAVVKSIGDAEITKLKY